MYQSYIQGYSQRSALKQREKSVQRQAALNAVEKMVASWTNRSRLPGCLYLFGSLLSDEFTEKSDIDFAIDGVNADDFFKWYALLESDLSRRVDLVDLTGKSNYFCNKVREQGRVIYNGQV